MIPTSRPQDLLTVKTLIKQLELLPPDLPVIIQILQDKNYEEGDYITITGAKKHDSVSYLGCLKNRISAAVIY